MTVSVNKEGILKRKSRAADNRCLTCGRLRDAAGCQVCRPRNKQAAAERRASRLAVGLCPGCGGERDADGVICTTCLVRMRERAAKSRRKKRRGQKPKLRIRQTTLVESCLRLVFDLAFRLAASHPAFACHRRQIDPEDLVGEGYLLLVAAARAYQADRGAKFVTYATHYIRLGLIRFLTKLRPDCQSYSEELERSGSGWDDESP